MVEIRSQRIVEGRKVIIKRKSPKQERNLIYNAEYCTGCGACSIVCPTEAIKFGPVGSILRKKVDAIPSDIDGKACVLCGICSAVCNFNALTFQINGKLINELKGYANLNRNITLNPTLCKPISAEPFQPCTYCADVCPTKAITIETKPKFLAKIDLKLCNYCSKCVPACPTKAIQVQKPFTGELTIDQERCQGCRVCIDVCPAKALYMPKPKKIGDRVDKVSLEKDFCIYCRTCVVACPTNAIKLERKKVEFKKAQIGALAKQWNQAFEKLIGEFK